MHDAGLGGHGDAVADLEVAGQADLAGEDHVVAQLGAAGNADLRDDEAMLAHGHVVRDLDEVIDLRACADNGRARARRDQSVTLAPISTSSRMITLPIWGTLRWMPLSST